MQIIGLITSQVAVWVLHYLIGIDYPINSNYCSNPLHISHNPASHYHINVLRTQPLYHSSNLGMDDIFVRSTVMFIYHC